LRCEFTLFLIEGIIVVAIYEGRVKICFRKFDLGFCLFLVGENGHSQTLYEFYLVVNRD